MPFGMRSFYDLRGQSTVSLESFVGIENHKHLRLDDIVEHLVQVKERRREKRGPKIYGGRK